METIDFYTSRGRSAIYLNKVATISSQTQSGVFYCRIPDANGSNRTIYIGIYNNEEGRIKVIGSSTISNVFSYEQVILVLCI